MTGYGWLDTLITWIVSAVVVILLIGCFVALVYFIYTMITKNDGIKKGTEDTERTLRVLAVLVAFLVYFGASALGVSIPELMLRSLSILNPLVYGMIFGIVAAAAGFLAAAFLTSSMHRSAPIAVRTTIFVAVLITAMFLDLFAKSASEGFKLSTLAPNLFFAVGLGSYLVFRWEP